MTAPRIAPTAGPIFVVRWIRRDGRDARHRYFRRAHDAQAFKAKLRNAGREARVYRAQTTWREES